ncbi:FAS1-like dehydratase domain-containing protein [Zeimonas arvi]|uniref:FAS1-like dehydratase domain-containing protein n=1 Tax=Zeimonas arvi TaxID=2498847 RepID=A0A5C8P4Z0_9BURK|nr:MaoC family dehydratase N-terminal domain-containing protein [Zeimonas arvi]TXL68204.1 hypothetical protein FHP08_00445 [Zeimonas arvi]
MTAAGLPSLHKGRFGASRLVRWCAAQQNWDRIHFDLPFARASGLRERVVNGALKQHLLVQFLERAFGEHAWIWRLDFTFASPDWVGEHLEVRGRVDRSEVRGEFRLLEVELEVFNLDQQAAGTRGRAVVLQGLDGRPLQDLPALELPEASMLDCSIADPGDAGVPAGIRQRIGTVVDAAESAYPLDLSRLRLFAEAVGDCLPHQFDPVAGRQSAYGCVVAPPLFPIHAIELPPGSRPLDPSDRATGREGSSEIGRGLAARLGVATGPVLNGGSSVEVHSLLAVGERVRAESRLASAKSRESRRAGRLLILEALNEYRVAGSGRLLLRERSTGIHPGQVSGDSPKGAA